MHKLKFRRIYIGTYRIINIAIFVAIAIFFIPSLTLAQLPTPTSPYSGPPVTLQDIQGIIETVARFLISISMIIAVIFIIWGGIMYMAAGDDAAKTGAARSRIINAIFGALVVLAVGLILQTLATVVNWTVFFNV